MKNKILRFIIYIAILLCWYIPVSAQDSFSVKQLEVSNGIPDSVFILLENGDLWAYGGNEWGQLGTGNTKNADKPVKIMTDVESVSAIEHYWTNSTYVLKKDNTLWAMGCNLKGQLLQNNPENITTPIKIMDDCTQLIGFYMLKTDGSVYRIQRTAEDSADYYLNNERESTVKYVLEKVTDNTAEMFPKFFPKEDAVLLKKDGTIFNEANKKADALLIKEPIVYAIINNGATTDSLNLNAYILGNGKCIVTADRIGQWYDQRYIVAVIDDTVAVEMGVIEYSREYEKEMITRNVICTIDSNNALFATDVKGNKVKLADNATQMYPYNYYLTADNTLCQWSLTPVKGKAIPYQLKNVEIAKDIQFFHYSRNIMIDKSGNVYKLIDNIDSFYAEKLFQIPIESVL